MRILAGVLLGAVILNGLLGAPNPRAGFYQWSGVFHSGQDLLTAARDRVAQVGGGLLRFYLGARFDYRTPVLSPERFPDLDQRTPALIAQLPHYRATLADPRLATIVLTVYPSRNYGGVWDDLRLHRPFTEEDRRAESDQISALARWLYAEFGNREKTVILANTESDDRLLDIMNYTGSPELAIENLVAWQNTRYDALEAVRAEHPQAKLRLLSAFEISLVNLRIRRIGSRFVKHPQGEWNAWRDVVPRVRFDLLSYSAYESTNSPFQTQNPDSPPAEVGVRLERDFLLLRRKVRKPVMLGEVGFAWDRFERLPSGGVEPRLQAAIAAIERLRPAYVVFWQVFDSPWDALSPVEWGLLDPRRPAPASLVKFLTQEKP